MIVISGALVLVALVLLIIGVVGPEIAFVYASIAVSLVSLVFLVIGILQRRGDPATAETEQTAAPVSVNDPAEGVTVRPSSSRRLPAPSDEPVDEPAPVAATVDRTAVAGGDVLVVEGRPRYHVVGCRYLSGKTPEVVDVVQGREEGFTPCGVCKPDVALAALAEEEAALRSETEELAVPAEAVPAEAGPGPVEEEDVPAVPTPAAGRRTGSRAAARPARSAAPSAPAASRTRSTRASAAPAPAASAPAEPPAPATRRATAARASTRSAVAPVTAPTRTAAPRAGSVVVIPDRGKYHREQCRYVRDATGTEVLSKVAATRQGYAACGVCKP